MTRQTYFSLYLLEIIFLFRLVRPVVRDAMVAHLASSSPAYSFYQGSAVLGPAAAWLRGNEDALLNGLWIGLVGLETMLVLAVAVRGVMSRLGSAAGRGSGVQREGPKEKTT